MMMVILFIFLIITVSYIQAQIQPVNASSTEVISIEIPKGSNTLDIAQLLKEKQLIKNELVFRYYVKYLGYGAELKAGRFDLSKNMNLEEIIQKLVEGNTFIETVRFTIPEGYNVNQIAERLAEQGLVNKDRFLQLTKEGNFDFPFIKQIPQRDEVVYKLEGYLFPETYEIKKGATEEEIIQKMLAQFEKEWKTEWNKVIEEKGMTIHDIVTLSSIIEREVVVDKERPIVAGVFYNRIRDSWNLQSCATVQFILGKQKDRLTYDDLEIDNPYNTYIYQGLPPGPIGTPGRKSLEAVVFPAENDYFFFVTKKDNSGEHYFSKTFAEHQRNNAKSAGNW